MSRQQSERSWVRGVLIVATLAFASCAVQNGPPATGANSSAPAAVAVAHGGVATGGGSNAFNRQDPVLINP